MSHPYDVLQVNDVTLIFTPCPGTKGTAVTQALADLKQAGASAVLTLTPSSELAKLQVATLEQDCAAAGLRWFHCPIEDDCAPGAAFAAAWQTVGPALHQLLDQQKIIAIHCKGGSGRTSLAAAQLLAERGIDHATIMASIKQLRPHALSLPPHVEYFHALPSALQKD